MNKYFFIISLLIFSAANVFAQETFVFKDKSKLYDVKVSVGNCAEEYEKKICNDKATFQLFRKNQAQPFQTIKMKETYLEIEGKTKINGGLTELYGNDSRGVYFADYNFDGIEDLGVSNGNYLPYGGISNDVFLYSKAKGKFIRNEELSQLESEKMSVNINKKLKTIETQTKSGCCWHEEARYRFVNNRLQKFYVFTEMVTEDGEWVELTTETRVKGKWRSTTKKVSVKEYYKQ
jgi:hypothetical protein